MSLDPIFEPLRQMPAPNFDDIAAARERMASLQSSLSRRQSATVAFDDRTIDGPSGKLKVRIYDPHGSGARGALLYLHGGGFVVGDLDSEHSQCIDHAEQAGCVVVSVDYRLAPEFPFPAAHDDAWAALAWLVAHADELRIDPERLAVGGGSAGATLAAGVALRSRDEGSPRIRLALLVQPALDHLQTQPSARNFADTPFLNKESLPLIWRSYFGATPPTGKALSYAAPAAAEKLTGFPPACLIVGDVDPLRDEGLVFAMRLVADGAEVELHLVPGAPHGFDLVEHAPVTRLMRTVQAAALSRALSSNGDWTRRLIALESSVRFHGPVLWALLKRLASRPSRRGPK